MQRIPPLDAEEQPNDGNNEEARKKKCLIEPGEKK
jgi:hypothetical protein